MLWSEGRGFTDPEVSLSKVPSVHTAPGALDWWLLAASLTECVKCKFPTGLIAACCHCEQDTNVWNKLHICADVRSVLYLLWRVAHRRGWRQKGGGVFPEPSKAEQRPGPLPVLLLLSRLDILVKLSNNAEFALGSCFYHLFKDGGKTKLYKRENPSKEGASKRNAVTNEPEVFLLVLKKGCTSGPSEQEETVCFTFTWKWSLMLKPCGYQSRTGLPSCVFLLRSGSLPEKWWCYRSDSFMVDQSLMALLCVHNFI